MQVIRLCGLCIKICQENGRDAGLSKVHLTVHLNFTGKILEVIYNFI